MTFRSMFRFTDADVVEGTVAPASEDAEREKELRWAMRSGLEEIPRSRLTFDRYTVEDEQTGRFYAVIRGQVSDARHTNALCFYVSEEGWPVYLELPPGPRNRDELAAMRERRKQRLAEQAKPRPWAQR